MLLRMLQQSDAAADLLARDPRYVHKLLSTIVARGYANNLKVGAMRLSGMAVPVIVEGQVRATFSIRHYLSAMSAEEAAVLYLPRMQEAAREIAAATLDMEEANALPV
ncbi:MAG: hypothetical protein COB70_004760 [Rhodobiaceae bacterium]|nr:hypothetical protein [Rhodobiaceae bacterium]